MFLSWTGMTEHVRVQEWTLRRSRRILSPMRSLDKYKQSNPPVRQHPFCCLFPRDQPGPRG